jgi:formate dehydrogenase major subunit
MVTHDPQSAPVKLTRRGFLKTTGLAMAGTAVGGLAALGSDLSAKAQLATELRIQGAQTYPSVCPYCAVGCGTLIHVVDGRIVNIEGNPESPVNRGTLCPKGAATFQLHVNPNRVTKVLHRSPGATEWETWDLDRAMDRIAELVKETRDETFIDEWEGVDSEGNQITKLVNMSPAIFSLGGATMANEWNHIQQKLLRGLGIIAIENQARI